MENSINNGNSLFCSKHSKEIYEDIADDVEKRFDASNYEINRPVITGKIKK